ncbi:MAG: sigma-70 family RNA polymerase sigma factor [Candidatus Hydrogenedentes bacterium]|nr:sigma-70 family RNA polymerase sigma factor [Candidatus Hydrogenedentota bacterium]
MNVNDAELFDRWRQRRDADAFAEIVSRHADMVYGACLRVLGNASDAEDAAQECFVALMGCRPTVRGSLAPWLHTVARRRALDLLRSEGRRRRREVICVETSAADAEDARCDTADLLAWIDEAIDELPESLRTPVVERFLAGRTHREIAVEAGVSEATVRHRIGKGVEQIRKALSRRGASMCTAALIGILGTELSGAAPLALRVTLGKMAIATPGTANAVAWAGAGGLLIVKKTVAAAGIAAFLAIAALTALVGIKAPESPENRTETVGGGSVTGEPTPTELAPNAGAWLSNLVPADAGDEAAADAAEQERLERLLFPQLDDSPWTIEGRVTDARAMPVPEALVSAFPVGRSPLETTHTRADNQGYYKVGLHRDGLYRVSAHKGLMSPERRDEVRAGSTGVDFVLQEIGAVAGRVVDADTRRPVTNFRIGHLGFHARDPAEWLKFRSFHDDNGEFRLERVEAGEATIFARAEGYVPARAHVDDVPPGGTRRDVVIALEPGHALEGIVRDPDGARVDGAEVVADDGDYPIPGQNGPKAWTDSEGQFQFADLSDKSYTFYARHDRYASGIATANPAESDFVEIVLADGASVEGVVSLGGIPESDASISVAEESGLHHAARSDAEGYYRVHGLTPGTVRVQGGIGPVQNPTRRSRSVEIEVRAGEVAVADLDFPPATASLEGNIYGVDMEPAQASITVVVDTGDAQEQFHAPRQQGHYIFEKLPAGPATVLARWVMDHTLAKRDWIELEAGKENVHDVYLDTGYAVTCDVRGVNPEIEKVWLFAIPRDNYPVAAESGEPANAALARAAASHTIVGPGESVNLGGLAPGTYVIVACGQWLDVEGGPDKEPPVVQQEITLDGQTSQPTVSLVLEGG